MPFNSSPVGIPATVVDRENPSLALDHQPENAPDPTRHHEADYLAHPAM
jgi:hypothetical protein